MMPKRPPETFHSDLHLPRWRRVMLAVIESNAGRGVITMACVAILGLPIIWLGLWWLGGIILAGFSFALGWNMAWRKLKRDGYLNRL